MSDEPVPPTPASGTRSPSSIGADQAEALFGLLSESAPEPGPPVEESELRGAFPQYEILGLLGQGGMGVVYQARHKVLDRRVAIKLLPPALGSDPEFVARFQREARAMARLEHPNIINVYDFGQTPTGQPYFVMEFVDGSNLADLIHSGAFTLPPATADSSQEGSPKSTQSVAGSALSPVDPLGVAAQLCEALAYAHGEGIVHRDIKPANVLIDRRGRVKVADFGLARIVAAEIDATALTTTGAVMGTLDYMAPEQRKGMHVDQRADIYSLGVMLYEMFCGEVPHGVFEPPSAKVKCDPRVDAIVATAMQSAPERRYQQTTEMKAAVDSLRAVSSIAPPTLAASEVLPVPASRTRTPGLVAMAVAALVIGLGTWWSARKSAQPVTPSVLSRVREPHTPAPVKLWNSADQITFGGGRWEANALRLDRGAPVYTAVSSRDAILRARVKMNADADVPQLMLRKTLEPGTSYYRLAVVGPAHVFRLEAAVTGTEDKKQHLAQWPFPRAYGADEWPLLELRAEADTLSVRVDGQLLGTIHDSSVTHAGSPGLYATKAGFFRDIEWVPLGAPEAGSTVQKPSAGGVATPQPIKLWTAPEPGHYTHARWEGTTVRLDGEGLHSTMPWEATAHVRSRDMIARTSIRMNPDASGPNLCLRDTIADQTFYRIMVALRREKMGIGLDVVHDNKATAQQWWPLPRVYGPDEWLRLEARAIGDLITVLVDEQVIGVFRDGSITKSGGIMLYARTAGYFRDIEYVPLDDLPEAERQKLLASAAIPLWRTPESLPANSGFQWQDGTLFGAKEAALNYTATDSRDAILRATVRMNPDALPQISLRVRNNPGPGNHDNYNCGLDLARGKVWIGSVRNGATVKTLGSWPLPRKYSPDEWMRWELRTEGNRVSVSIDGQVVGEVNDVSQPQSGGAVVFAKTAGYFRDIEYVPLAHGWCDLIPLIDPARDAVRGNWKVENGALLCTKPAAWAFCTIPLADAPGEYDLRFRVTRGEGSGLAMFFAFRKAQTGGYAVLDYFNGTFTDGLKRAGLENLTKGYFTDAGGVNARRAEWLPKGKLATVLLQVRDAGVTLLVDGERVFNWPADWSRIRQPAGAGKDLFAGMDDRPVFGVGIHDSAVALSGIEMLEVTPEPWRDVFAEIRANSAQQSALHVVTDGSALRATSDFEIPLLRSDMPIRDGAMRVRATCPADQPLNLKLRLVSAGGENRRRYEATFHAQKRVAQIQFFDLDLPPDARLMKSAPLPASFDFASEHTYEFRVVGDSLSIAVDGAELVSTRDSRLRAPGAAVLWLPEGAKMQELKILSLDQSAPVEPWHDDLAQLRSSGALQSHPVLKDDGTRLSLAVGAGYDLVLVHNGPVARDAAIRVGWPASTWLALRLRQQRDATNQPLRDYTLHLEDRIKIGVMAYPATPSSFHILHEWDYPAGFDRAAEHAVEFRAVGDKFSVALDGREIGSLNDDSIPLPGTMAVSFSAGGSVGSIETLRLDQVATAGPWHDWIADMRKKNFFRPEAGMTDDGSSITMTGGGQHFTVSSAPVRNAVVRLIATGREGSFLGAVQLRSQLDPVTGEVQREYQLGTDEAAMRIQLHEGSDTAGTFPSLKKFPLAAGYQNGRHELEFEIVDELLTVRLDGREVGSLHDSTLSQPGHVRAYLPKDFVVHELKWRSGDR